MLNGALAGFVLLVLGLRHLAVRAQRAATSGEAVRPYHARVAERRALPMLDPEEILRRRAHMASRARKAAPVSVLAGIALLATGHVLAADIYSLFVFGEHAQGRITGYQSVYSAATQQRTYFPKAVFSTPDGQEVRFQDRAGSGAGTTARRSGEQVDVFYAPGDPQHAMIYRGPLTLAAPLALFAAAALALWLGMRSWFRRA